MGKAGSRRGAICVAGAGFLLCGLALVLPEPKENSPFALAVGVWPGMETLTLAKERGVVPEQGVNFVELSWTSATLMAFENRVVDGAVVTLDEMLRLKVGGHAIKAVLVMGASVGGDAVVARPPIRSLPELKGKRVGVELRASGEYLLARALRSANMALSDVVVVPLNSAEAENAYDHHELDAVVTRDPSRIRILEKGAQVLFDSRQTPTGLYRVLVVRDDLANEHEEVLGSLVKAHFEMAPALRSARGRGRGMGAVLRRERLSADQFAKALDQITDPSRQANVELLGDGPGGLGPVLKEIATFMKQEGLLDHDQTWEGLLDARLVKEDP